MLPKVKYPKECLVDCMADKDKNEDVVEVEAANDLSEPTQVTAQKMLRTFTSPDAMREAMKDDTMEPHLHMAMILMLVFVLAIVIGIIGL